MITVVTPWIRSLLFQLTMADPVIVIVMLVTVILILLSGIDSRHGTVADNRGCDFAGEQECIPVGCVPPARYRMGVLPNRDPWTETPLLQTESPQTETPLDRDPSGQRPPWTEDPPGQRPPVM